MLKEAVIKCLNSPEPAQALMGFHSEMERYRESEPILYNGFIKTASRLIGDDFLISCFKRNANRQDVALIQTIEKKASDEVITNAEILNYIHQGGLFHVLEKSALAVNGWVNSNVKPGLEKKAAGIASSVASVRTKMNLPGMKNVSSLAANRAKTPRGSLGIVGPAAPGNIGKLQSTPNMALGKAPPGQQFLDPKLTSK